MFSSPICRARETAELGFGKKPIISLSLIHRSAVPEKEYKKINQELRILIFNAKSKVGHNSILAGHRDTFMPMEQVLDFYRVKPDDLNAIQQGGFVVIKIENNKIKLMHIFTSFREFTKPLMNIYP